MSVSGRKSEASKLKSEKVKYAAFEAIFQNLKLKTTKGTQLNFKKVKQPIVLLNFWASWCLPCVSEFSSLNKFIQMLPKDKVLVVGINNDDESPKKAIKKTESKYNLGFESFSDSDSSVTSRFYISKIPASIIFYKGKVVHFTNEEFDFVDDNFIIKIKKLLKK